MEANSPEAVKLGQDMDAVVVPVEDLASVDGPAAVPDRDGAVAPPDLNNVQRRAIRLK